MAQEEKICHYIDIPIQHASDRILKAMNRRSTKASILDTLSRLRKVIPDNPYQNDSDHGASQGRGNEEFEELVDFVETQKFERLGVFTYSKEEGTPASRTDQTPGP